ncbi:3-phosphoshikimate 1-carboxyvinyltransferase [Desulfitobacterium chlororespirans]|uniref:3-phosphoshikimate 1-carboxyvinyltransferase n=1 Tax=Desulfitobacterium chlororespirans DSM 11544 TaxID=1121395 RepID=A0A1M7U4M5_9FIRM|nr:3-phosphoshikimate 1-carboxyvinyltransferase [Desulfitobacterium chlororespirans]SHN78022.1 3-phosphoshikimate 1-carboxyvinyltransferase [Desulfitobacterium chlororespirans DSM 11544]
MQTNNEPKGIRINPMRRIQGEIEVPGDKSISHRAALFGGMAQGETHITNFLLGQDCLSTLECLKTLGVEWERRDAEVWIRGRGFENWHEPQDILDVGNSGTTMRLMLGVLAGCPFSATLTGDSSIRSRPMARVTLPLQEMGARILGRQEGKYAPLTIQGGLLQGIQFRSPVASAQVKSAILLAGLRAEGETMVTEPFLSRDHTERMLRGFGVDLKSEGCTAKVRGGATLSGQEVSVPGDISSAAFFLVLGTLIPQGELLIKNVGMNPTRTGILDALWQMGADIQVEEEREECGEPRANLRVRPAQLHGIEIQGEMIPKLIDEVPVLAVAASFAQGETTIRDAAELRVKETDRIETVVQGLQALGGNAQELPDGLRIQGAKSLRGGAAHSHGDHRLAMAWVVAGLLAEEGISLEGIEAAAVSFPNFLELIHEISKS